MRRHQRHKLRLKQGLRNCFHGFFEVVAAAQNRLGKAAHWLRAGQAVQKKDDGDAKKTQGILFHADILSVIRVIDGVAILKNASCDLV